MDKGSSELSRKELAFPRQWLGLLFLLPLLQDEPSTIYPPPSACRVSSITQKACERGDISPRGPPSAGGCTWSQQHGVHNLLLPVSALEFWRTVPGVVPAYLTWSILLLRTQDLGPLGQILISRHVSPGLHFSVSPADNSTFPRTLKLDGHMEVSIRAAGEHLAGLRTETRSLNDVV